MVALGAKHPQTARKIMEDLDRREVMEFVNEGPGRTALLRFRPIWDRCTSPEFRAMLLG
jgi:hypothetical protein